MPAVTRVLRKLAKAGPIEWRAYWRRQPIQPHVVLYEAFAGSGVLCNPEAIFRQLLHDPHHQHLTHLWAVTDPHEARRRWPELAAHARVRFVPYGSLGYHRALATAGYLVNNATFPPAFSKRPGQTYLNTWHGTPLKQMGYDTGDRVGSRNVLRNLVAADYLVSGSPFMTEQLYESAYRLDNVFEGKVIEEGTPRTDRGRPEAVVAQRIRRQLQDSGVVLGDGERLVLYAPTWHGDSFHRPEDDVALLQRRVEELQANLPDGHRVLLKLHQQVLRHADRRPDLRRVLVPGHLPTNEVLAGTDVLVTDYSSIFFDFLPTGRPILFLAPDLDRYERDRGVYLPVSRWPGPVTRSTRELAEAVGALGTGSPIDPLETHAAAYGKAVQDFAPHDDGQVSRRVVDVVFGGGAEQARVGRTRRDGRPKVLMYVGGLRNNGITASAINLLRVLGNDRCDVSVFYNHQPGPDQAHRTTEIPEGVRLFPSVGSFSTGKRDRRQRLMLLRQGAGAPGLDQATVHAMFADEWRRCFGDARFDHIIDFSGYAPLWSFLTLQGEARSHSIWLHTDIKADQLREVGGRRPHFQNLGAVISMYHLFDRLVSVSPALAELNRDRLAGAAPPEKFTWVPNVIDEERVQRLAREGESLVAAGPHATFVSIGRLSPEKHHDRLFRAFAVVHEANPDSRLLVVGDGPLRDALTLLARRLGIERSVRFAGHLDNPYGAIRGATALVVASDYEGHSVVTLEARVLGLPVVSTDYPTVSGVLPEGVGEVVPRTVEGLAEGMRRAVAGVVPHPPFDVAAHNRAAVERFFETLGVPPADDGPV